MQRLIEAILREHVVTLGATALAAAALAVVAVWSQRHHARLFRTILGHRVLLLVAIVAATVPLAHLARGGKADMTIESMFPVWDRTRDDYDAYREAFPFDDAVSSVLVEAKDLWTNEGLARVRALEDALRGLPGVVDVDGPTTARDVVADGEVIRLDDLVPPGPLDEETLARCEETARTDPLFRWTLSHPERSTAAIRVRLSLDAARSHEGRSRFNKAARRVVAEHAPRWEHVVLTGLPAIRGHYTDLVLEDNARLMPLGFLVILVLLTLAYRSIHITVSAVATMALAIVWTLGVMAGLGISLSVLTLLSPLLVMVISISDTVHIVSDLDGRLRAGEARAEALPEVMAEAALPCLLTEVTIALGFLSMAFVNIRAVVEFGLVTAIGMLLAWVANVTVLPLALSLGRARLAPAVAASRSSAPEDERTGPLPPAAPAARVFGRFLGWIERQVTVHPRRVVACAILLVGASLAAASTVEVSHRVFDDLRPESELSREIRYAEAVRGGVVPLALYIEPDEELARRYEGQDVPLALEPAVLRFLDAAETHLEATGMVKNATSVATYLRKAHALLAGEEMAREDGGLPTTRRLAMQEATFIDDGQVFRDILSFDQRSAAVLASVPDVANEESATLLRDLEGWAAKNAPEGYRVRVTGVLAVADRVQQLLVGGLIKSFGSAILVTLLVFFLVLRSFRLALIGIIPNVTPIALMLGVMAVFRLDLKPSTVLPFSMVLVIADDDTIQYLSRFRERLRACREAGAEDPYREATLSLLRALGLPMFVTSTAIASGFLLLRFSAFLGPANLGLIAGLTLFVAVFADLFLLPIVIMRWRPRV